MNKEKRRRLRKLAAELMFEYRTRLQFYESLNFDDRTKADALDHVLAIEFKYSNIERTKDEIQRLQSFTEKYLIR